MGGVVWCVCVCGVCWWSEGEGGRGEVVRGKWCGVSVLKSTVECEV